MQRFGKYFRVFDVFVDHLVTKLSDGHPLIAGLEPPEFFRLVQTVDEDEPFFAKGFNLPYSPPLLLRRRQTAHLGRFALSRILNVQASTLPVGSVAKRPIHTA